MLRKPVFYTDFEFLFDFNRKTFGKLMKRFDILYSYYSPHFASKKVNKYLCQYMLWCICCKIRTAKQLNN